MDNLLILDERGLEQDFDRCPFRIRHRLIDHPLFELPRLIEMSARLPEECVEYNAGNLPIGLESADAPRTGLSLQETLRRIEECGSWIVLKNVERDPEYRDLLHRCLDEIAALAPETVGRMHHRVGFIFVSSPGSVTPLHLDPEHNFLLHIRGTKTIHVADPRDREAKLDTELERYFAGGHRNLPYSEALKRSAARFDLLPGDGVHVPFTAPHWVAVGAEVAVSFSVTFQNPESERREIIHKVNAHLRRRGLHPAPPGRSRLSDAFKYNGFHALRRMKRLLFGPGSRGAASPRSY